MTLYTFTCPACEYETNGEDRHETIIDDFGKPIEVAARHNCGDDTCGVIEFVDENPKVASESAGRHS